MMATTSVLSNVDAEAREVHETSKMWKCGEPYKYPLPPVEGDPWKLLLTPLIETDKAQCDAWKDEVQNLLIFAGLFSAVVTTFVIETYQGLQEDPNDVIIMLLTRISDNLASPVHASNSSDLPFSTPTFSPASSTIRINIYFFISLILSLTTVLVGIVSLQWLREYQAYNSSYNSQNAFAAMHMRSEALKKWYVPEIFSALPLLLQVALVLFFVGVVEFLLDINIEVLIPVALVISLTLVFLGATTALPTFQAFLLHHPYLKISQEVPIPCPYKSPQSMAFRKLITSSRLVFYPLSLMVASTYWITMRSISLCRDIWRLEILRIICAQVSTISSTLFQPCYRVFLKLDQEIQYLIRRDSSKSWTGFDYMASHIYDVWKLNRTSLEFDAAWLSIRDNYFQSLCQEDSWLYQHREEQKGHGAIYDATLGLCKELKKEDINMNADFEIPIFVAYHCGIDLSSTSVKPVAGLEELNVIRTRNQYITMLLHYDQMAPLSHFSEVLQYIPQEVLQEVNAFILLQAAHIKMTIDIQLTSPRISLHLAEVYFRLLGYLFSQPSSTHIDFVNDESPELIFSAEELYGLQIFDSDDQPFTTQWALTIHTYFQIWNNVDGGDLRSSFHGHPFICHYIWNFWKEVDLEASRGTIHPATLTQVTLTLGFIDSTLVNLLAHDTRPAIEHMFFPAATYAQICFSMLASQPELNSAVSALLPTLARCRAIIGSQSEFETRFSEGMYDEDTQLVPFSQEWWDVLFPEDVASSKSLSLVIQDQETPPPEFPMPSYDPCVVLHSRSERVRLQRNHDGTVDSIV